MEWDDVCCVGRRRDSGCAYYRDRDLSGFLALGIWNGSVSIDRKIRQDDILVTVRVTGVAESSLELVAVDAS